MKRTRFFVALLLAACSSGGNHVSPDVSSSMTGSGGTNGSGGTLDMAAGGSGGNGSGGSNAAGSGGSHGADGQSGSGGSGGVGAGGSGASISQRDDAGVAQDAGDSMADAAVANPAGCPATYAELAAMSSCSPPGVGCAYAEGYCSCVGYCGGAPPDPNVTPPPNMWSCVPLVKGCPIGPPTIGAACTDENQTCTYGACCIQLATCKKAAWSVGPLMCPP